MIFVAGESEERLVEQVAEAILDDWEQNFPARRATRTARVAVGRWLKAAEDAWETIEGLKADLRRYGQHGEDCLGFDPQMPCQCGFREACRFDRGGIMCLETNAPAAQERPGADTEGSAFDAS